MNRFKVKNFQSIKDEELELEGLTVVTGPSNLGKSSLVRSLNALVSNDFHPSWIRNGTKKSELELEFPDPFPVSKIKFEKAKSTNQYDVEYRNGHTESLPKVGKNLPEPVAKAGFAPLVTERQSSYSLNVSRQLDPLFFVSETDTEISSIINGMFGTAPFEVAQRKIAQESIKNSQLHDELEGKITEDRRKLAEDSIKYDEVKAKYKKVLELLESVWLYQGMQDSFNELINYYVDNMKLLLEYREDEWNISKLLKSVNSVQSSFEKWDTLRDYGNLLVLNTWNKRRATEIYSRSQSSLDFLKNILGSLTEWNIFKEQGKGLYYWTRSYWKQEAIIKNYQSLYDYIISMIQSVSECHYFKSGKDSIKEIKEGFLVLDHYIEELDMDLLRLSEYKEELFINLRVCEVCPIRIDGN